VHILITGGCGFIGKRLTRTLLARGSLDAGRGAQPIERITVFDVAAADGLPDDPRLVVRTGDVSAPDALADAAGGPVDGIFHLAAVVSGAAEADFDLGMRVNLDGTLRVLAFARAQPRPVRLVFASSVAAYGGELPDELFDGIRVTPQTSYGTQKVIGELLYADATRKGLLDGRCLRLPTIVVRPGRPNAAASSFASGILREPLNGEDCVCPVPPETGIFVLSPARVVAAFIRAFELPADEWGWDRVLQLPGITVTVRETLDALAEIAGPEVAARVRFEPDSTIMYIVRTWPVRFRTPRAEAMGFEADPDIGTIIRMHIDDELGGRVPG
jgi:nucleoside-diphosphate-sugar epimerase